MWKTKFETCEVDCDWFICVCQWEWVCVCMCALGELWVCECSWYIDEGVWEGVGLSLNTIRASFIYLFFSGLGGHPRMHREKCMEVGGRAGWEAVCQSDDHLLIVFGLLQTHTASELARLTAQKMSRFLRGCFGKRSVHNSQACTEIPAPRPVV